MTEIAMDHLVEFPRYYDQLADMEKKAEADLKESYNSYLEILREENYGISKIIFCKYV